MDEGRITEVGSYAELVDSDGAFAEFLRTYTTMENKEEDPGNLCVMTSGSGRVKHHSSLVPRLHSAAFFCNVYKLPCFSSYCKHQKLRRRPGNVAAPNT